MNGGGKWAEGRRQEGGRGGCGEGSGGVAQGAGQGRQQWVDDREFLDPCSDYLTQHGCHIR